jgi:hypothetical protein
MIQRVSRLNQLMLSLGLTLILKHLMFTSLLCIAHSSVGLFNFHMHLHAAMKTSYYNIIECNSNFTLYDAVRGNKH